MQGVRQGHRPCGANGIGSKTQPSQCVPPALILIRCHSECQGGRALGFDGRVVELQLREGRPYPTSQECGESHREVGVDTRWRTMVKNSERMACTYSIQYNGIHTEHTRCHANSTHGTLVHIARVIHSTPRTLHNTIRTPRIARRTQYTHCTHCTHSTPHSTYIAYRTHSVHTVHTAHAVHTS